jgi:hypothetical protein
VQDEIFFDKVRLTLGGRVDKFGNLDDPVFSPRLAAVFRRCTTTRCACRSTARSARRR